MTKIYYEINPPVILNNGVIPINELNNRLNNIYFKINKLKNLTNGVQFTDSALGNPRLSSINLGSKIREKYSSKYEIICNIRTCDHNLNSIIQITREAELKNIDGLLLIWGDTPKFGVKIKTKTTDALKELKKLEFKIKLYSTIAFNVDERILENKLDVNPDGIITPPIPSIEEFYKFKDRINERNKKMDIISTIFIPSEKNLKALKLIKFDWSEYQNNLYEFAKEVFNNSNGVLISSPNDFQEGLKLIRRMRTSV